MRYLVRLITCKGGIVLDPFGGSGTTGIAAKEEGFNFILFEREKGYADIARSRLKLKIPSDHEPIPYINQDQPKPGTLNDWILENAK
jgi:DNA modification methylase